MPCVTSLPICLRGATDCGEKLPLESLTPKSIVNVSNTGSSFSNVVIFGAEIEAVTSRGLGRFLYQ